MAFLCKLRTGNGTGHNSEFKKSISSNVRLESIQICTLFCPGLPDWLDQCLAEDKAAEMKKISRIERPLLPWLLVNYNSS